MQLGAAQLSGCWTAVGTSCAPAQASWDLCPITWLATSLADLVSKVFTLRGAKCDSVGLTPACPSDARGALSPALKHSLYHALPHHKVLELGWKHLPSTHLRCRRVKTSNQRFWRRHWLPLHCGSSKSGTRFTPRRDGSWVCWYHWYRAGRAGRFRVQEPGDSFTKIVIICVTLCSECPSLHLSKQSHSEIKGLRQRTKTI